MGFANTWFLSRFIFIVNQAYITVVFGSITSDSIVHINWVLKQKARSSFLSFLMQCIKIRDGDVVGFSITFASNSSKIQPRPRLGEFRSQQTLTFSNFLRWNKSYQIVRFYRAAFTADFKSVGFKFLNRYNHFSRSFQMDVDIL